MLSRVKLTAGSEPELFKSSLGSVPAVVEPKIVEPKPSLSFCI